MFRKLLVTLLGLAFLGVFAVAEAGEKMKVLYHLNELEKAYWVLELIRDHVNVVGTDNVDIVLVVHGPALKAFHKENGPIEVPTDLNQKRLFATGCTAKRVPSFPF